MFKISGRQEFNKSGHINDILIFFAGAIGGLYCVHISHLFTIPAASTPRSGGQVCVTVSEQANWLMMMMKPCVFKGVLCVCVCGACASCVCVCVPWRCGDCLIWPGGVPLARLITVCL